MSEIKAIIFDMDGVLIDAKEWHYEALNRALGLFGFVINRYDHLVTYDGLPTAKKLELLSRDRGFPRWLHRFTNEMKQRYTLELIEAHCRPHFNHEFALSRLKAEGYTVGVASNSVRVTVELMMERAHLDRYLDFMLSNQDVTKPKPDPEIYLMAARMAGVAPHECVVVEDNHHGVEAATRAGANVLHVQNTHDVTHARIQQFVQQLKAGARSIPFSQEERRAA